MVESAAEETDFTELVGPELASAIEKKGYTSLTPVQRAVLDPALAGRDLRISSQTGSGKTVAIGFTIRETMRGEAASSAKGAARPRALVVAPTRELAKQVETELSWLYAPLRVNVAGVTGGGNYRDERRALGSNPGIVVGTPGRLLDHLQRGSIDGTNLGAVVLDEADRMLDLGFRDDLEAILGFAPKDHRTHLVSATFPREVLTLANRVQTDPMRIEGTPLGTANTDIEHLVHLVAQDERLSAIVNLLLETPEGTTLIFARTRADVGELTHLLGEIGFRVDSLSGEMEQRERNKALASFKRGDLDALVATDVAARGIDVQDIARVLHAEPPGDVDAYTHRSGRTGRAGRQGKSSVLVTPPALARTASLLNRARVRWRFEAVPTADAIEATREERLFEALTALPPTVDPAQDEPESDPKAAVEPGDRSWALAKRIMATGEGARALARMISRSRASGPEARRITTLTPPRIRGAETRTETRGERGGEVRGLRPEREPRQDREERAPREREERAPRDAAATYTMFRVSWGQIHGADQRRLLAMVCRRGGIRGTDVGAIRVARTFSTVAVADAVAEQFENATREPDPRDPRVKIRKDGAPATHSERELPADTEEAEAPPAAPPARESKRSVKELPAERPSKKSVLELPVERESKRSVRELPVERESKRSVRELPVERESKKSVRELPAEPPSVPEKPSKPAKKSTRELPAERASTKSVGGLHAERSAKSSTLVIHRPAKARDDHAADSAPREEHAAPAAHGGFSRAGSRSDDLRKRIEDARRSPTARDTRDERPATRDMRDDRSGPPRSDRGGPPRSDRGGPARSDRGGPPRDDRRGPPPPRDDRGGPPRDDRRGPPRDDRRPPFRGGPPPGRPYSSAGGPRHSGPPRGGDGPPRSREGGHGGPPRPGPRGDQPSRGDAPLKRKKRP